MAAGYSVLLKCFIPVGFLGGLLAPSMYSQATIVMKNIASRSTAHAVTLLGAEATPIHRLMGHERENLLWSCLQDKMQLKC